VKITTREHKLYSFSAEVTTAAIHHPSGAIQATSRFQATQAEIVKLWRKLWSVDPGWIGP
jgi:hypothetical protein